jgi:hypothetical protein
LGALTAPCYIHKASPIAVGALLAGTEALVLAGLLFIAPRWSAGKSDAGEIVFAGFLLLFLIILLRPSVWSAPITLAADSRGVYFVGGGRSHFVPWQETGPMWLETAYTGDHSEMSVVLAIRTGSTFWDAAKQSNFMRHSLPSEKPPGYLPVPLGTQGIDPQVTRECLEALRALSGVSPFDPQYDPGSGRRRWELVAAGSVLLAVSIYFIYTMLHSFFRGYGLGVGLVIPVAMALAALSIVRYGWNRRC